MALITENVPWYHDGGRLNLWSFSCLDRRECGFVYSVFVARTEHVLPTATLLSVQSLEPKSIVTSKSNLQELKCF